MINKTRQVRTQLWAIIFACTLPIILSYLCYFFLKPQGGMSYGHLLTVQSVAQTPLRTLQGQMGRLADFNGKWLLIVVAGGACDAACQDRLFAIRQYRAGQGVEASRISRLWLLDDDAPVSPRIPAALLAGVNIMRTQQFAINLRPFWHQSIFLVDPQGNQVMRYQLGQDHRKVMNELTKIIKNNQALG